MNYYIGIDLGTTALKCGLFDEKLNSLAFFCKEYPLIAKGDFVEQDSGIWWSVLKEGITFVCKESKIFNISAISVSAQGISVVPVDKNGKAVGNAISWLDARAKEEIKDLDKKFGKKMIYQKTGKPLSPYYSLTKIKWLIKNNKKCERFLFPLDFVNYKLTELYVTDYSTASGSMLYNLDKRDWDDELLKWCGATKEMFSEVKKYGKPIGKVSKNVVKELGINEAWVIMGAQDQKLCALAVGIKPNCAAVSLGTATAVLAYSKAKEECPVFAVTENENIFETSVGTTGAAVKWLKNILNVESYEKLDELATKAGGSGGVKFDFENMSNLNLAVTNGNLVYALYEGICKKITECIKMFEDIKTLYVYGGGAKSKLWCKLLGEISQCKIVICNEDEIGTFAAAKCAMSGGKEIV